MDGKVGVMKYQKIDSIDFIKKENGYWVKVVFENGTEWLPSFIDLGKILSGIATCEDQKYPHGEGRNYAKPYYLECIETKDPEDIKNIYNDYFNPNNK